MTGEGEMGIGSDHNWISIDLKWVWVDSDWNGHRLKVHRELEEWQITWEGERANVQGMADDFRRRIFSVAMETIGKKIAPLDT